MERATHPDGSRGGAEGPLLAHEVVGPTDGGEAGVPRLWFLHGIYGAGRNWGSVARRVVERKPGWGAVLVDLRLHGDSRGFPGPHTLEACAADLRILADALGQGPRALLGHSFGGKVVLETLRAGLPELRQAWVVDASPSARRPEGSAVRMLEAVRELPPRFPDREAAVAALEERGFEPPVARWMSTNLERREDGFGWRFDLDGVEALLEAFFASDLWAVVERPPRGVALHVVKATRSEALPEEECRRLEEIAARGAPVRLHRVRGGHWLNADAPDAVVDLLAGRLP